ncbi:MAG: type II CAAX prenyl endopeptidase Rce1 family protein [Myxococcota bacterium]
MSQTERPTTAFRARAPRLGLGMAALFYLVTLLLAVGWAALTTPGIDLVVAAPCDLAVPWWAAGLGTGLVLVAGTWLAERWSVTLRRLEDELGAMVAPATWWRVGVLALLSGVCEEALFRGPVQHSVGVVFASVGFALLHGGLSRRYLAWSTFALVAGMAFGGLAETYQSIAPSALAHVVVNGVNLRRLARYPSHGDPTT